MSMFWRRLKYRWQDRGLRGRVKALESQLHGKVISGRMDLLLPLHPPAKERIEELENQVAALCDHLGVVLYRDRGGNPYRVLKPGEVPQPKRSIRSYLYDEENF